jgi:hypothetical protein
MTGEFGLPEGWWISDRGPVSPNGRLYDSIPAGYEIEDLPILDAILDGMLAGIEEQPPIPPPAA